VLAWCYKAEMGTANSLLASAYYGKYNERFSLVHVPIVDTSKIISCDAFCTIFQK